MDPQLKLLHIYLQKFQFLDDEDEDEKDEDLYVPVKNRQVKFSFALIEAVLQCRLFIEHNLVFRVRSFDGRRELTVTNLEERLQRKR